MDTTTLRTYRREIGKQLRRLRQEHRWSQVELARRIGVSQGWLSQIESGNASLNAEQLLYIARLFNVSFDHFLPKKKGDPNSQIQNALARLGATHLHESEEVLPTERLSEASNVIREVLAAPESPRYVTGLAPVLVEQSPHLNLSLLRGQFAKTGLERRLGWVLDNTKWALQKEINASPSPSRETVFKYRRALNHLSLPWVSPPSAPKLTEDIFDPDIAGETSLEEARKKRSELSRKWGILSFIQPEDFQSALRQVYGPD